MRPGINPFFAFVGRRVMFAIPTIFALVTVVFVLVHNAPGDPLSFITGDADMGTEQLAELRREYGLDKPLIQQYAIYVSKIFQGDLGASYRYREPVLELILDRIPATMILMVPTMVLFIGLGILLGVIAARSPNSVGDLSLTGLALFGWSVPVFWLGQLLVIVFALKLGWLPTQGMLNLRAPAEGFGRIFDIGMHLILPGLALGMRFIALATRMTRASMMQVMRLDYMTTARAKGVREPVVLYRHALPNALLPVITIIGMNIGTMLTGSVLVEVVFAWPGMGRLLYDGVLARDYPLIIGIILVTSIVVILINLITDILYAIVDPRIRYT
ncbi:Dipeptide transport system permease protein DppB [Hyphomicrobiales bacterium]|jgi:peptide/nickel transport system permease protein|nr:Di/tripeptide transport system permease protein DppB [Hyphomicrobiales bacterium]CAH1696895.1 Dipeptide transport system permease protein DppB [Hyphomicrobiales bacterium]